MTVEVGQATLSPDPQASLRTELVGQLAAAQLAIEAAIAELSRNGCDSAAIAATRTQRSSLIELRQQIGFATGSALANLRSEVTAAAASATALANQTIGSTGNAAAANADLTPAQRARATIEAVGRDLFDKHVLDPYLQFSSPEEEEAYRRRERERQEAFEREKAKNTSQGDRRAVAIEQEQLRDAGAHGADRSPEFGRLLDGTRDAANTLNQMAEAASKETKRQAQPASNDVASIAETLRAAGLAAHSQAAVPDGHGLGFDKLATISRSNDGRA